MSKGEDNMKIYRQNISVFKVVIFVLLTIYSLSLMMLIVWGILAALKSVDEFRLNMIWLPKKPTFENFTYVFNHFYVETTNPDGTMGVAFIENMLFNSVVYVTGASFFASFMPFLTAYLTVKFPGKLSNILYTIVVIAVALPIVGATPSELQLLNNLGLFDSFFGIFCLRGCYLSIYFLVFHAMFKGLSKDFSEAAALDGASEFRIMAQIIMPIAKSTFFAVWLIHFISYWNDYQAPLLYLPSKPTISYGLYRLSNSTDNGLNYVPMRMIGVVMLVVPVLTLYLIFKNKILKSIALGGSKE